VTIGHAPGSAAHGHGRRRRGVLRGERRCLASRGRQVIETGKILVEGFVYHCISRACDRKRQRHHRVRRLQVLLSRPVEQPLHRRGERYFERVVQALVVVAAVEIKGNAALTQAGHIRLVLKYNPGSPQQTYDNAGQSVKVAKAVENLWSLPVLEHHSATRLHNRVGRRPPTSLTGFPWRSPKLAHEITKDP